MFKRKNKYKIEDLINDLQDVLLEVNKELQKEDLWSIEKFNKERYKDIILEVNKEPLKRSFWSIEKLEGVKEEMEELLDYALKGEVFFKYGKKQRMLESTYLLTDSQELFSTELGKKISSFQDKYNKL